ncbi:e3 ubiquitin-protein ligase [Gigaspora margarita]|uniref:E3 ubiquitin-protein ligase n=1 Tax=Gigaspora margarita TaxID=4874 RepID=A0A8H4ERS7_GIGMA|nr:e3 ubiquitin-protein ligase [Gigaspora margarita]
MNINPKTFKEMVQEEQKDFMKHMMKPEMVAENFALLENVLVITVYLVPHQGSSSSTSNGIVKVFNKACNYQKGNSKEFPFNHFGLAEKSPHNPLKVLHSLLEPNYPAELPEVAIIGISNWRLDNSKSSRTLLVQSLHQALARNFRGTNQMDELYKTHFSKVIKAFHGSVDNFNNYSIEYLIKANLKDKNACHLMIIGKSNSIINILTYKLKQWNKELVDKDSKSNDENFDLEPIVIYSSQFPDDFGDDYQYSVLSRIMMCVEMGRPLILTDLDKIYGSLYDLWNQNYITVGKNGDQTFYTRIALGAYSNPLVCIHKNFRCILVLDDKDVDLSDLPLLNRFEKQKMTINDMIDNSKTRLLNELVKWSIRISTLLNIEGEATSKFNE